MPILIWRKKKLHKTQHTRHSCTYLQSCNFFFICKLKVHLFNILLERIYKKIPEATYTYIYCTSVKDYLLNLLGNVEVADLIAPHVAQLTTMLSEPACRLIKPIEIDYNLEHQYLFDFARKRFTKESGSLKGSPRAFIRYEYSESKKPNPAPFIEGTHIHFAIFSNSNQLISKLSECPNSALSLLITPYHTLSPRLERKSFSIGNFQISSQAPDFLSHLIMPCHSLLHLITPYPLGWTENHFHLATLKLVPSLQIFYHILSRLVTPYHNLSHLIPYVGKKTIFNWQL